MLDIETRKVADKALSILERGVVALERLADHFSPLEAQRDRRPATLGTAIYDRDERERKKIGETIRQQKPEPPI